jgi:hypothetical protein
VTNLPFAFPHLPSFPNSSLGTRLSPKLCFTFTDFMNRAPDRWSKEVESACKDDPKLEFGNERCCEGSARVPRVRVSPRARPGCALQHAQRRL